MLYTSIQAASILSARALSCRSLTTVALTLRTRAHRPRSSETWQIQYARPPPTRETGHTRGNSVRIPRGAAGDRIFPGKFLETKKARGVHISKRFSRNLGPSQTLCPKFFCARCARTRHNSRAGEAPAPPVRAQMRSLRLLTAQFTSWRRRRHPYAPHEGQHRSTTLPTQSGKEVSNPQIFSSSSGKTGVHTIFLRLGNLLVRGPVSREGKRGLLAEGAD